MDDLLNQAEELTKSYGKLHLARSKAEREIPAVLERVDRFREGREYQLLTPQGRQEREREILADAEAIEGEIDALVKTARETAEQLAAAGYEPGVAKYGTKGFDPAQLLEDGKTVRFSTSFVTLDGADLDAYNRLAAITTEEVGDAESAAALERMLDAALASGDKGRLFAVARAIDRLQKKHMDAPNSQRLREQLDEAYERLRDPRRGKAREVAAALNTAAMETSRAVSALRRDELAREAARAHMRGYF
jgi:hypothetical protein